MPLQIIASDSVPGRTLSYAASGLPPGIGINSSTGLITGTPTTAGSYSTTVTVTDNTGISGNATFPWSVTPTPQGNKARVGASADSGAYGSGYTTRANTFNTNVGRLMATNTWKAYINPPNNALSGLPPNLTLNSPQSIGTASGLGAKAVIACKPLIDPSANYTGSAYVTEGNNLKAYVKLLLQNNVTFDICLWNEMNNGKFNWTVSTFHAAWNFYGSIVHAAGGTLSWCPAITNSFDNAVPLFPTSPLPDGIHIDWYSNDFFLHSTTPITYGIQALADAHSIPMGLGEFGPSNDPSKFTPTTAQWVTFCTDQIIGIYGATPTPSYPSGGRLAAGKANTDIIYFSDVKDNTKIGYVGSNGKDSQGINLASGIQPVFDALNA